MDNDCNPITYILYQRRVKRFHSKVAHGTTLHFNPLSRVKKFLTPRTVVFKYRCIINTCAVKYFYSFFISIEENFTDVMFIFQVLC